MFEALKPFFKINLVLLLVSTLILITGISLVFAFHQHISVEREIELRDCTIAALQLRIVGLEDDVAELEEKLRIRNSLLTDNQQLRKTIKTLSSRGSSVPVNYVLPDAPIPLEDLKFVRDLGIWKLTFYTPSVEECGSNTGITASGKYISPGYTIAVDTAHWKVGTLFYVEGWGVVEAMDTGSSVKGANRADIALFDPSAASSLGVKQRRVWLVERP